MSATLQPINLLLIGVLALSLGCDDAPPPVPAPSPAQNVPRGHRWGEPFDWVNDPPPIKRVEFRKMEFETPVVRDAVLRWESAATGLRDAQWHHESWYRSSQAAIQWWSNTPQFVEPGGWIEGTIESKPGEVHAIRISCHSNTNELHPEFAVLMASWMPETGWGAFFRTAVDDTGIGQSMVRFSHRGDDTNSRMSFNFFPGVARWQDRITFDEVNYYFQVAIAETAVDDNALSAPLDVRRLSRWNSSAEAFRDDGLKMLDELERAIKVQIPSDAAIRRVTGTVRIGGTHGGDPPMEFEKPVERPLSDDERSQVLNDALNEISQRRAALQEHYGEWHSALIKVFPLNEVAGP